jgi:hypothetical protein
MEIIGIVGLAFFYPLSRNCFSDKFENLSYYSTASEQMKP